MNKNCRIFNLVMFINYLIYFQTIEARPRSGSTVSSRSVLPYVSSPNLSRIQESRTANTTLKKRLSYKTSPIGIKNSLKRSIPRKISTISSSISPTFSVAGSKKTTSGLFGHQLLGSYKSLNEKASSSNCILRNYTNFIEFNTKILYPQC